MKRINKLIKELNLVIVRWQDESRYDDFTRALEDAAYDLSQIIKKYEDE